MKRWMTTIGCSLVVMLSLAVQTQASAHTMDGAGSAESHRHVPKMAIIGMIVAAAVISAEKRKA